MSRDDPTELRLPAELDAWLSTREDAGPVGDPMAFVLDMVTDGLGRGWGGPFGAAAFSESGELLACGVNLVLATGNTLLHAEVTCLHRLMGRDGGSIDPRRVTFVSSAEPCAMCAGAIHWYRPARLLYGATRADVERIGFDEGPKSDDWAQRLESGGVDVEGEVRRASAAALLERYRAEDGTVY